MKIKAKIITLSIMWGLIIILFSIVPKILCTVIESIDSTEETLIVRGVFLLLSLIPAITYIYFIRGLSCHIIKGIKRAIIYFIPCIIIILPMIIHGFVKEDLFYYLAVLFFTLTVGITEELYYHGIITTILNKKFSINMTILFSALIFGFGHTIASLSSFKTPEILLVLFNAIIFGWLSAELLHRIDTLLPVIAFHFLFDFISKVAKLSENIEMIVFITRSVLIITFAVILLILRLKTFKIKTIGDDYNEFDIEEV